MFADEAEPLLAAAFSGATSRGDVAVNGEHATLPELFAQSIDATPRPESASVPSPEMDSDRAIVGNISADLPAVTLPAVVEPVLAPTSFAERFRGYDEHLRRRSAQGAALIALTFAIVGGAYWAHRPSAAPEDRSGHRGVIASAQPAVSTPFEPFVAPTVVHSQSALTVSSPSLDDEPFEPRAAQVTTEEPTALPVAAEPTSPSASGLDAPPAPSRAVTRSVPSTTASGTRKSLASRAYDAPPSWPTPASAPGERACTQAVAALGLCDSPGSR